MYKLILWYVYVIEKKKLMGKMYRVFLDLLSVLFKICGINHIYFPLLLKT